MLMLEYAAHEKKSPHKRKYFFPLKAAEKQTLLCVWVKKLVLLKNYNRTLLSCVETNTSVSLPNKHFKTSGL